MTEKNSDQFKDFGVKLINEVNKVLVGQETMVNRLLTGLLAGGHVLIEGMPGLAKTTADKVQTLLTRDFLVSNLLLICCLLM